MKRPVKIAVIIAAIACGIFLARVAYEVIPFLYVAGKQMRAGHKYMDSLTEADIQTWIERTKTFIAEYDPQKINQGYGIMYDKPVPPDLERLKIIRIDVSEDRVCYVWMGGMDHTWLEVTRLSNTSFRVVARYDDERTKVIREGDANNTLELTAPAWRAR